MAVEEIVRLSDIIGSCGKYQVAMVTIIFTASQYTGFIRMIVEVLAPSVFVYWDWEAHNPNKTIFKSTECKMADVFEHNRTSNVSNLSSKLVYESLYSRRTLTEELNMICERSWLVSFLNTLILFGVCFGGLFLSRLCEIYGRKRCTVWMASLCLIANILCLFPQGYVMFALTVTLYGANGGSIGRFIYFQVLEMTSGLWSEYAGYFCKAGQLIGQTLLVGVAWILQNWFYTQIFHTVITAGFLVSSLYALESPLWLAVRGKYDEAEKTINKILIRNGLDPNAAEPKIMRYLEQIRRRCEEQSTAEKGKFSDQFRNRTIAFYTFAQTTIRSLVIFVYLSLVMNAESFGSGLYVDLTISNALAIVCSIICAAFLKKFSIRTEIIFLCLCGGTTCIFYTFLYDYPAARSALISLGRCFMSPVTTMVPVFGGQLFPTSVRTVSDGFRAAVAGLFSALTPFTKELSENTALYVPFILFAVFSFVSAGLLKTLPETRGKELPHTVDELAKRKNQVPVAVYTISNRE